MQNLTANSFTTSNLSFLSPDETVFDAYAKMQQKQIRHLPVVKDGKAIGIISNNDLQFVSNLVQDKTLKCSDIMTANPYLVSSDTPVKEMLRTMLDKKINSVLIQNDQEKIVGIFTSTDAMKILLNE